MYFDDEIRAYNVQYVSGYERFDSIVKLKCLECGCEWETNIHNLLQRIRGNRKNRDNKRRLNHYVPCPECRKRETERKREENRKAEDMERFVKSFSKWLKHNTVKNKAELKKICKNCGIKFITTNSRQKYCCSRCKDRSKERRKELSRNERLLSRRHDKGITLDRLYRKYKGVCYLCGQRCDYNDFKKIDGSIAIGKYYPTIEHVIPVSKGGTDTWDNVRLAHMICNSIKGNKFEEQTSFL